MIWMWHRNLWETVWKKRSKPAPLPPDSFFSANRSAVSSVRALSARIMFKQGFRDRQVICHKSEREVKMKWSEIRRNHPNKFILLGDIVEEKISDTTYRILEGKILMVADDGKEIRKAYNRYRQKGMNVLYSLPATPTDFIIENVPFKGILR
jgi:hypothetical protein